MNLKPLNDLALVEVESNQYQVNGQKLVGGENKEGIEHGILRELPKTFPFFGFYAFAFESSLNNPDAMKSLSDYYSQFVGKRVYWTSLAERGSVLEIDNVTYAMIKPSAFIAWSEPEVKATSVQAGRVGI